jgi:hypothetical protein
MEKSGSGFPVYQESLSGILEGTPEPSASVLMMIGVTLPLGLKALARRRQQRID